MAPLSGADFHNPSLTGPRPSHSIPNGGVFSAYGSAKIKASPETVYKAILTVEDYKQWNSFVTDVTITKNPSPHRKTDGSTNNKRISGGSVMIFHCKMTPDAQSTTDSRLVVTLLEKLKLAKDGHSTPCVTRIRWNLDNAAISTPRFLFQTERTHEIEEAPDGTTIYRSWETMSGPVSRIVRYKFGEALKDRFQDWSSDLKNWCEKVESTSLEQAKHEMGAVQS